MNNDPVRPIYYTYKSYSLYSIPMSISGGNLQECIERQTEYIGTDLNIANNGIRNKVNFILDRILIESFYLGLIQKLMACFQILFSNVEEKEERLPTKLSGHTWM